MMGGEGTLRRKVEKSRRGAETEEQCCVSLSELSRRRRVDIGSLNTRARVGEIVVPRLCGQGESEGAIHAT